MIILIAIFIIILLSLIQWVFKIQRKRSTLPPGPYPLPLIGNLHLLMKDIHLSMDRLSLQYGDMYTLWMAHIPYIVITNSEIARKVCLTTKFADRLPLYVGEHIYTRGSKDMIMADYTEPLKIHRKLVYNAMQKLGENKNIIEDIIITNVNAFIEKLKGYCEKNDEVLISDEISLACFNMISTFVFGERVNESDIDYQKMKQAIFLMMQSGVTLSPINFYPILRYIPNRELKEMLHVLRERDTALSSFLNKAEKNFSIDKIETYTDALLHAKNSYEDKKHIENVFSRDHIEMNIFDMFLGGVESTATTITWAVMYLIKWPQIQVKVQQEIKKVLDLKTNVDIKCPITLLDRSSMPYLHAVIYETMRLASPLPFGVFHKARVDTELKGYNIPKGLPTMINLWTIHHKEEYFAEPYKFIPERFLDSEGNIKSLGSLKNFFPFSVGPRECIGKDFAMKEIFLFLANLLYTFSLKNSTKNISLDLNGTTKVSHAPKPFYVLLKYRKK